ncbi:MAG: DNA primase [Caldilineaceae bacterium]|nr:DNA primase [Caldilineaceae bacterium]
MSVVDEIKQRINIVDLISRYVPLKKTGVTYKSPCPFHDERTPSFVVFPQSDSWHCFGACGTGGDIFSFLMRKENLDFREALQMLAAEAGVNLDETGDGRTERTRTTIFEVNAAAAAYFREILLHHDAAAPARSYLEKRQIDTATAERFQLGFALDSWDGLREHLLRHGHSLEAQLTAGLLKQNEERTRTYDAFRGRVMIPICDRQGRIIGFGGRVLGDGHPKYLNTSETDVFHKSRVVYGLDKAHQAIRAADKVVIVEGYMDVIAAHQHGFENVVACMGTALTPDQLRQLQRYTDQFVLALDADTAGQQATVRGLNQARQALARVSKPTLTPGGRVRLEERLNANLFIVSMPSGRDPDDVVRQDAALWEKLVAEAQPLVDFYFQVVATQYDLQTAQGKGAAVSELAPLIAELGDEIEQQHYIQQLSRLIQIDETTITGRVQAAGKTLRAASRRKQAEQPQHRALGDGADASHQGQSSAMPPSRWRAEGPQDADIPYGLNEDEDAAAPWDHVAPAAPNGSGGATRPAASRVIIGKGALEQEDYLLAILLQEPDLLIWMAGETDTMEIPPLRTDDFERTENQEIFRALKQFITSNEPWELELFQETLTGYLHGRLGALMAYGAQLPQLNNAVQREVEFRAETLKVMLRLRIQQLKNENTQLKYLMQDVVNSQDAESIQSLNASNNHILRERFYLERALVGLSRTVARTEAIKPKIQI